MNKPKSHIWLKDKYKTYYIAIPQELSFSVISDDCGLPTVDKQDAWVYEPTGMQTNCCGRKCCNMSCVEYEYSLKGKKNV